MTTEQKVFLFSEKSANSYGYSIGLKKDGTTVQYTAIYDSEDNEYKWEDKKITYKGSTEDFLAIKQFDYEKGTSYIYANKTEEADPFLKINNPINLFIDTCGSMGKDLNKESYGNDLNFISNRGTDYLDPESFKQDLLKRIQGVNKNIKDGIMIDDSKKPKIK